MTFFVDKQIEAGGISNTLYQLQSCVKSIFPLSGFLLFCIFVNHKCIDLNQREPEYIKNAFLNGFLSREKS